MGDMYRNIHLDKKKNIALTLSSPAAKQLDMIPQKGVQHSRYNPVLTLSCRLPLSRCTGRLVRSDEPEPSLGTVDCPTNAQMNRNDARQPSRGLFPAARGRAYLKLPR